MYWRLFQLIFWTFAPVIPVNPKIRRQDLSKNSWIVECSGFESFSQFIKQIYNENKTTIYKTYQHLQKFWTETMAADQLRKKNS
jgi:hypothetical protein